MQFSKYSSWRSFWSYYDIVEVVYTTLASTLCRSFLRVYHIVESLHLTPTHNFVRELLSSMLHNEGLQVHPICGSFIWELLNLVSHNEGHTKLHNNCRSWRSYYNWCDTMGHTMPCWWKHEFYMPSYSCYALGSSEKDMNPSVYGFVICC